MKGRDVYKFVMTLIPPKIEELLKDELREFDTSYVNDTRSTILKRIAVELGVEEKEIRNVKSFKDKDNAAAGFTFETGKKYKYYYKTETMEEL